MEKEAIEEIIRSATVCRLAMRDGERPYIIPMCFGYRDGILFFHGSLKSRKYGLLRQHPVVCFEFDRLVAPLPADDPCDWEMRYQSVVGFGRAAMLEEREAKRHALTIIAAQYAPPPHRFPDRKIDATGVFQVVIESMTGKSAGSPPDPSHRHPPH
jgi:nitroimidazol reductase NimA-like FMN-containing flavoprotein (pyridoxamine 5'-phosphate oxidase superfamily)